MALDPIDGALIDVDADAGTASPFGTTLPFQYMPIGGVKTAVEVLWKDIPRPGHSHAALQDGGGGKWTHELQLVFYRDGTTEDYVSARVRWLQGLLVREYDSAGNYVKPPHTVLFVLGEEISTRCKVTGFKVTWGTLWDPRTQRVRMATVDLTLAEVRETAVDYKSFF